MIPVLVGKSGILPDLGRMKLRLVPTPVACKLTGLSTDKLREWTSRRALVPADVRPKRKGSPARFSWQTILVLRIAMVLRDQFSVELQAYKGSFARLRKELHTRSFLVLWGCRLALAPDGNWVFVESGADVPGPDALVIALDPHLLVLRDGFALPDDQLDLFSLPAVRSAPRSPAQRPLREARRSA